MEGFWFKIIIDLIWQARDIQINHMGRYIKVKIPDLFYNQGSGDDLTRVSHEKFEKRVLLSSLWRLGHTGVHLDSRGPVGPD
jgi:hypothetical protein